MRSESEIIAGRIIEGEQALRDASSEQKAAVLTGWRQRSSTVRAPKKAVLQKQTPDQRALIKENVAAAVEDSSRGNAQEDALIAQAIEASLISFEDDRASIASSVVPTSTASWETDGDDDASTLVGANDDPAVHSDEDENMKKALEKSKQEK